APLVVFSTVSFSGSANSHVDALFSHQSFTGLTNTPNAQVISTGDFNFYYGQGVPYRDGIGDLDNWVASIGVFPGLEASGRVVTKTYDCQSYTQENCGIRDLSASLKYQIPYIYDHTGFNLALGVQDLEGAANNFETYYIVADKTLTNWPVRFSAGYGQSELSSGIMDGAFGGIEVQPWSFIQLTGEYDASEFNSSIKAITPENLLPFDAQLSLNYQIYSSRDDSAHDIWGVNLSAPLVGYTANQPHTRYSADPNQQQRLEAKLANHAIASQNQLIHALRKEGFLNIQLGVKENRLVVALENQRYLRNQMDGAGVALGIIAANTGTSLAKDLNLGATDPINIELVMLSHQIPMIAIQTQTQCYREFLTSGKACESLEFTTDAVDQRLTNVQWLHQKLNSSFGRSQVILSPATQFSFATEYGFLDYSLALATNLYVPLWQGFAFDTRYILPIDESDDYESGAIWGQQAYESEIDRAVAHQAFALPFNIMTQFSAGYVRGGYLGGANETQWNSPQGYHSIGFNISEFTYKDDTNEFGQHMDDRGTLLGHYRLSIPEYNWQLELQAGEFWQRDQGVKVTTNHWLGDTNLHVSYLNSEDEEFVTVGVSLPLNLWRGMKPGLIQVKGTDQYTVGVQTRVGDSHNNLNNGLGGQIEFQHNLEREYLNRNRLSPSYYRANMMRLRHAYLRYLDTTQS
ncbi:MAG: YjbH domain-containing protein, partial [Vibrio sp.]